MTMSDPIADMLSRIRNGLHAKKKTVDVPTSTVKTSILDVMVSEGYLRGYENVADAKHPTVRVELKYFGGKPVISELERLSRPGLRSYSSAKDLPSFRNGLGTVIISTSKGVMSDTQAQEQGLGGELMCKLF